MSEHSHVPQDAEAFRVPQIDAVIDEASIDTISPTPYTEVLGAITDDPESYADVAKKLATYKQALTPKEFRMAIRGLAAAGDFPKTDTSDKLVTVTKHDRYVTRDNGDVTASRAVIRGESSSVRKAEDSVLIGELPFNAAGKSLAECTEDMIAPNLTSIFPLVTSREEVEIIKRADNAISRIHNDSSSARRHLSRDNGRTELYNQTFDAAVPTLDEDGLFEARQAVSAVAIDQIKAQYLQLDAELAASGVEL